MKIKDLLEGTFDDLGLKGLGSELDKDDEGEGFKQMAMFDQLGKILDSANNPKPVKTVKTDDGKEIEVTPEQARMLRLFATTDKVKPNVRTRFINDIQKSSGLYDFVDIKDYNEMPKLFMQKYLG